MFGEAAAEAVAADEALSSRSRAKASLCVAALMNVELVCSVAFQCHCVRLRYNAALLSWELWHKHVHALTVLNLDLLAFAQAAVEGKPLFGVPMSIKDMMSVKGCVSHASSPQWLVGLSVRGVRAIRVLGLFWHTRAKNRQCRLQ
jgi:hypothetical protein